MGDSLAILVVDDDQSIQSVVEEILGEGGFQPAVASTGEEALRLLSANRYRLLVIDISFGNDRIKGWDVARRARAINPSLPVIYITGANGNEWAIQGVPNSILLTKPFAPAQLIIAASTLLNAASPLIDPPRPSARS